MCLGIEGKDRTKKKKKKTDLVQIKVLWNCLQTNTLSSPIPPVKEMLHLWLGTKASDIQWDDLSSAKISSFSPAVPCMRLDAVQMTSLFDLKTRGSIQGSPAVCAI